MKVETKVGVDLVQNGSNEFRDKRVVFMGTPEFSVQALQACHDMCTVVGVFTQPDRPVGRGQKVQATPVKARAETLGLKVFQPEKLTTHEAFQQLSELRPDVIVVVAYGQLLKQNVLDLPKFGCINIHASLLPRWRGAAPIQWSILSGDHETGVTTMRMALKLDAGNMLEIEKVPITEQSTSASLFDQLSNVGATLIVKTLRRVFQENQAGTVQDESKVTYASKLTKEMQWFEIETITPTDLDRRVRALNPWPGVSIRLHFDHQVERIVLRKGRIPEKEPEQYVAKSISATGDFEPILMEQGGRLFLRLKNGLYEVTELQPEGSRLMPVSQYIQRLRSKGISFPIKFDSTCPPEVNVVNEAEKGGA